MHPPARIPRAPAEQRAGSSSKHAAVARPSRGSVSRGDVRLPPPAERRSPAGLVHRSRISASANPSTSMAESAGLKLSDAITALAARRDVARTGQSFDSVPYSSSCPDAAAAESASRPRPPPLWAVVSVTRNVASWRNWHRAAALADVAPPVATAFVFPHFRELSSVRRGGSWKTMPKLGRPAVSGQHQEIRKSHCNSGRQSRSDEEAVCRITMMY